MTRSSDPTTAASWAAPGAAELRFERRTPASSRLWEQACATFPLGVSGSGKFFPPHPVYLARGAGSRVVDIDGNEYVDLILGSGANLLGHAHPRVVAAVREEAGRISCPTMPGELGLRLAERMRGHMPYLERMRFTVTGSEATRSALRVARGATGRTRFAKCEGIFHGSDDQFLVSTHTLGVAGDDREPPSVSDYAGGGPRVADEVVVIPHNDPEAATEILDRHGHELACVFIDPVAWSSGGAIPATPEFAQAVAAAARRHGALLVVDEVVSGYRLGLAGAPAYLGVQPDLSTLGKAIGGGLPLSAFGGRADLLGPALAGDRADRVYQSGTYVEHPLSIAAGMAALDVLEEDDGLLARTDATGERLRAGLREAFAAAGVTAAVSGVGSLLHVHIGRSEVRNRRDMLRADQELTRRFLLALVAEGVLWLPLHPAAISVAHAPEDVDVVLAAARRVLELDGRAR